MSDTPNLQDHIVRKNFNFLRVLQRYTQSQINVEFVKRALNYSRTSADRAKDALIEVNAITKNLTINPNFATFLGISISYREIEITVVGLDGKVIPWADILSQTKCNFKEFDGKITFNYTSSEFINIFAYINELIGAVQSIFSVKAICLAFDKVDLKKGTFSLTDYFTEYYGTTYSFYDFRKVFFSEISKDTMLFLECNAMCQMVSEEFPMLKREYNSLYINIEQNGCFAALLYHNTLQCGYNMQTLNLSGLLDEKEKNVLASNDIDSSDLASIYAKILKSLIVPLTPEWIYFSGKPVSQNSIDLLQFQKSEIFGSCLAKNYSPNIKKLPNSMSKGAAILAMYHYYGWDYTCI